MNDPQQGPPAVLLVDDEPEILHSLKGLLRREFDLHTAESGQQALEILREHPIQVIMTDQRMPEMTGAQLLSQVREVSPETVRIIFTGYADIKAVVDAVNEGQLYRYITKPWDPDELIATLTEAAIEFQRRRQQRDVLREAREFCEQAMQDGLSGTLKERGRQLLERIEQMSQIGESG
jgi:DNA-binding NtrC family response regulator